MLCMSNRSNGGSGGWGRDLQQRGDDSKINEKKNDQVEWIWGPILISQLDWGLFPVPQLINHKLKNFQILKLRKSWVWILSSLMILVFRNQKFPRACLTANPSSSSLGGLIHQQSSRHGRSPAAVCTCSSQQPRVRPP